MKKVEICLLVIEYIADVTVCFTFSSFIYHFALYYAQHNWFIHSSYKQRKLLKNTKEFQKYHNNNNYENTVTKEKKT